MRQSDLTRRFLLSCFGILLRLRGNVCNLLCPLRSNREMVLDFWNVQRGGCVGTSLNQKMSKTGFEWVSDFTGQSVFDQ